MTEAAGFSAKFMVSQRTIYCYYSHRCANSDSLKYESIPYSVSRLKNSRGIYKVSQEIQLSLQNTVL
jgi:hypothetical protein